MTNLDWDKILDETPESASEYDVLPEGSYQVSVREAEATTAKSSGNEMLKVVLEVTEGPHKGRWLWTNIAFATGNARAMSVTLARLTALGVTREWLAANRPSLPQIATKITGTPAVATVAVKQWEGKDRNEVTKISSQAASASATSGAGEALPAAAAAAPAPAGAVAQELPF